MSESTVTTKKIRLHILTPVNIGCDDIYEPTNFKIDKERKKLIVFDPLEFVKILDEKDRKKLNEICSKGKVSSILELYHFIDRIKLSGKHLVDVTDGFIAHYKEILGLSIRDNKIVNKINQFTINRTAYDPYTQNPIVPGSSLKGALRTAYLSSVVKERGITNYWEIRRLKAKTKEELYKKIRKDKLSQKLEREILEGDFSSDPFSLLKISDLHPVNETATKILYAVNLKKDGTNASGPYQIVETIGERMVFEGTLNLTVPVNGRGVKHIFQIEDMLAKAHSFFARRLKEEIDPIRRLGIKHQGGIRANSRFKDRFKQDVFLIRLGRHSGAESVTIEGNRLIKIRRGKRYSDYLDHSTTIYLASHEPRPKNLTHLIPFGWAVLEVVE